MDGTLVTDAGLRVLQNKKDFEKLHAVGVGKTAVTDAGVNELRRAYEYKFNVFR
jgi:hypothetical protein